MGRDSAGASEHVDVLILGAGLSGVGAACHLRERCPEKSLAILEARDSTGGTWDLFRYPGIRSDSDMYTLGYVFRPWQEPKSIADGPSILKYIRDTASDHGVERLIRLGHRAVSASWSSEDARWTVLVERGADQETVSFTCDFLYCCTGYYRYDEGYSPSFEGSERFGGEIIHPQHWPDQLDCAGKRVVVIGSGATAVTLVPALAREGARDVTMLQRSPTYVVSLPACDPLAERLRGKLSPKHVYTLVRWRNVLRTILSFELCRRAPGPMSRLFKKLVSNQLPPGYDVDTHFTPRYNPWDQRLCLVPDGDLFEVLSDGRASIATGRIDCFTETGVRLEDGEELAADIIVTATGLNLLMLGGIELTVDGAAVELGSTVSYKGMMLCGVPNLALALGYTNASWTLKADLVAEHVCRLLRHMDARGAAICTPRRPDSSPEGFPMLDLKSGYVLRSIDAMPKQGASTPWRLHQNYLKDLRMLRRGPVDDQLELSGPTGVEQPAELAVLA